MIDGYYDLDYCVNSVLADMIIKEKDAQVNALKSAGVKRRWEKVRREAITSVITSFSKQRTAKRNYANTLRNQNKPNHAELIAWATKDFETAHDAHARLKKQLELGTNVPDYLMMRKKRACSALLSASNFSTSCCTTSTCFLTLLDFFLPTL